MTEKIDEIVERIKENTSNVRFSELCKICEYYFGPPRQYGSSHMIYRTPWEGNPRINIQDDHGRAKVYQVRQALAAINKLWRL